jgi:hypothetical protein
VHFLDIASQPSHLPKEVILVSSVEEVKMGVKKEE